MKFSIVVLFFFSLLSCQPKPIDLGKGFDSEVFRSDRNACKGKRILQKAILVSAKDSLLGHSENELFSTLGRYDLQMLDKRNQKVFIYFLEAGPQCDSKPTEAASMAIYFNATKLVKEVTFQNGIL